MKHIRCSYVLHRISELMQDSEIDQKLNFEVYEWVAQLVVWLKFAYVYTQVFTCLYMHSYLCIYVKRNTETVHYDISELVSDIEIYVDCIRHESYIWYPYVTLGLISVHSISDGYCYIPIANPSCNTLGMDLLENERCISFSEVYIALINE
jgi:hypothetical protein